MRETIVAASTEHLNELVQEHIRLDGHACDLNHIDVSGIRDMSNLFKKAKFNGDVSRWNVSNVINMERMFEDCRFNGDISQWDTGCVQSMRCMFHNGFMGEFQGDISAWNVSNVTDMAGMFCGGDFGGDLNAWDVSSVKNMTGMFMDNGGQARISRWDVANVTTMEGMFQRSKFTGDISGWNVSGVLNMTNMFTNADFRGDLSQWAFHPDLVFAKVLNVNILAEMTTPSVFFWHDLLVNEKLRSALDTHPAWKNHWEKTWPLLQGLDLGANDAARLLQERWMQGNALAWELALPEMGI